jgi:hypothetical protein
MENYVRFSVAIFVKSAENKIVVRIITFRVEIKFLL